VVTVRIFEFTQGAPGNRHSGAGARAAIESVLAEGESCVLVFAGVDTVTQSFADEAVGVLVRTRGPGVLDQLTFSECSPAVRDMLEFVADYSAHFWETGKFPSPQPA
jgi:hypothetical protein